MYAENELLFPPYVIPKIGSALGSNWKELVDRVSALPEDHPESLAFSLMMIHFLQCLGCETDCYRAMRGCIACAKQALRRHKDGDLPLLNLFDKAKLEIEVYTAMHPDLFPLQERSAPAKAA